MLQGIHSVTLLPDDYSSEAWAYVQCILHLGTGNMADLFKGTFTIVEVQRASILGQRDEGTAIWLL